MRINGFSFGDAAYHTDVIIAGTFLAVIMTGVFIKCCIDCCRNRPQRQRLIDPSRVVQYGSSSETQHNIHEVAQNSHIIRPNLVDVKIASDEEQ